MIYRKFFKILFVLMLCVFTITGCTKQTSDGSSNLETESSVSDIKYADLIPDPQAIFTDGNITITDEDGGTAYIFRVENYKDGEYESYISECKKLGFDDVEYDTEYNGEKKFGAYTSDREYWVNAFLDIDGETILIICQKSLNN